MRALHDRASRRLRSLRFPHRKTAPRARSHSSRPRRHHRPFRALRRPRARSRRARTHTARATADVRSARGIGVDRGTQLRRSRSSSCRASARSRPGRARPPTSRMCADSTPCAASSAASSGASKPRATLARGRFAARDAAVRSHDRDRAARSRRRGAAVRQGKDALRCARCRWPTVATRWWPRTASSVSRCRTTRSITW